MPSFVKITAAGNDFVLLDGRQPASQPACELARDLCPRRLSVGADGLLVVSPGHEEDGSPRWEVVHHEPDGGRTFCLNGVRGAAAWLVASGAAPAQDKLRLRCEGVELTARVRGASDRWEVSVAVPAPEHPTPREVALPEGVLVLGTFVDVGNPQLVVVLDDAEQLEAPDLMRRGRSLRWSEAFPEGTNVSFVAPGGPGGAWRIRTYERGVEGETLACGTGVVAAAAALLRAPCHAAVLPAGGRLPALGGAADGLATPRTLAFWTRAGDRLDVTFPAGAESARVWASGPVRLVARGEAWAAA